MIKYKIIFTDKQGWETYIRDYATIEAAREDYESLIDEGFYDIELLECKRLSFHKHLSEHLDEDLFDYL